MAEGAALLVDHVLPAVGYRQWVLSFSGPLAVRLGYDRELLAAVSGCLGGYGMAASSGDVIGPQPAIAALIMRRAGQEEMMKQLAQIALEHPEDLPTPLREAGLDVLAQLEEEILSSLPEGGAAPFEAELVDTYLSTLGLLALKHRFDWSELPDLRSLCTAIRDRVAQNPILLTFFVRWMERPEEERRGAYPSGQERDQALYRALHYCLVLHVLSKGVAYDTPPTQREAGAEERLSITVIERVRRAREATSWKRYANLFERMKIASVDQAIDFEMGFKIDPEGSLRLSELRGLPLQINILEAMYQDKLQGCGDNAWAGYEMFLEPTGRPPIAGLGNTQVALWEEAQAAAIPVRNPPLSLAWTHLYQSWNLAFCSMYPNNLDFYSKLLAPVVAGYAPDRPGTYMHIRAIALYLHACHELIGRALRGSSEPEYDLRHPSLTRVWGEVNREAAQEYQRQLQRALDDHNGPQTRILYRLKRALYRTAWTPASWTLGAIGNGRRGLSQAR